jgi:hypothetical protein
MRFNHEMLTSRLRRTGQSGGIAAKVTEVLADLILMASPVEPHTLMAGTLTNLGGMVLEKSQETDPTNPRRSSH